MKPPTFVSTVVCRLMELMVATEHDGTSSCCPPQERAAETQEEGSHDAPAGSRQQRGVPSTRGSQEGAEGSSAVVTQAMHKAVDSWRLNGAPEETSDGESVGCMENVSSDGQLTALIQPLEPTLITSLFPEVVPEGMFDSEVCRTANDQSNPGSCTELGGQEAEALLPSELSKSRAMVIDGIEEEGIGVEDWLDVTHAMLDTGGLELDLK